jgi:hypothetical protein
MRARALFWGREAFGLKIDGVAMAKRVQRQIAGLGARPGLVFLIFLALTFASFAAMRLWTMPLINTAAGGLPMLDMRMEGYSAGEAGAYLAALAPEGRAAYLGPQRLLDTLLPLALTGTLSLAGYLLTRHWSPLLGVALALVPLAYCAFDLMENAHVAALLRADAPDNTMAEAASRWTVLKGRALRISLAVVLVPLAGRALDLATGGKDRA